MSEQTWKPLFRTPESTVTRVLRSPAFLQSRERAAHIVDDAEALLALAAAVELLDMENAPLSAVADRVTAAVRLLRDRSDRIETGAAADTGSGHANTAPAGLARERLLVAALHYLVTPLDLVPDFQAGGYIDDVLLLSWVFGAAVVELEPYLDEPDEES